MVKRKEKTKETNQIFHIELGFVNAYLVKTNKGFILIDTGFKWQYDELKKQLVSFGCIPGKLKLIIITHGDTDHIGNCDKILKEYNTKKQKVHIAMHKADFEILKSGIIPKRKIKNLLFRFIVPIIIAVLKLFKIKMSAPKFNADVLLEDGQDLKKYGFDAEVIHVPGHTKGSIAIITKTGDIFSGDTIVNNKKPQFAYIIENEKDLNHSIAKLKSLNLKRIFPGHGKPFLVNEFDDFKF